MAPDNTDGDIQLGRDDLAVCPTCQVRNETRVHGGGGGSAHGGIQFVGKRLQHLEVLTRPHAAPARYDDFRRGQFRSLGLGDAASDETRDPGIGAGGNAFDGSRAAFGSDRVESGGAHGDDLERILRLHRGQCVAGIDGPHKVSAL